MRVHRRDSPHRSKHSHRYPHGHRHAHRRNAHAKRLRQKPWRHWHHSACPWLAVLADVELECHVDAFKVVAAVCKLLGQGARQEEGVLSLARNLDETVALGAVKLPYPPHEASRAHSWDPRSHAWRKARRRRQIRSDTSSCIGASAAASDSEALRSQLAIRHLFDLELHFLIHHLISVVSITQFRRQLGAQVENVLIQAVHFQEAEALRRVERHDDAPIPSSVSARRTTGAARSDGHDL
mmetsp:Transcript_12103/g.26873  ORF Transcript_12103/g.26873 Transcript_12103/m.26873 type:complete len:239 (-) Transcript_12103:1220-1936(-)